MDTKYHELLSRLSPYIIARPETISLCETKYMGQALTHYFNPLNNEHSEFFERVLRMDSLAFGPGNMAMPKWVFFDCAMMPGAVIGFGIHSDQLSENDCAKLAVGPNSFVPLSMYIAIPNADNKSWFGHNLSSLNGILEYDLKGLGLLTKYYALGILKIRNLIGATQWSSKALSLHLKLSSLELLSSQVIFHTAKDTLCYSSENFYSQDDVFTSQNGKSWQESLPSNNDSIQLLQKRIEMGERLFLIDKTDKELMISSGGFQSQ